MRTPLQRLLFAVVGLGLAVLLAFVLGRLDGPDEVVPSSDRISSSASAVPGDAGGGGRSPSGASSGLPALALDELPAEARHTLQLIDEGGPYPYERDGVSFGNFEGILPGKSRGYYREYTVPTPGESDRGARRIVVGKGGERYYTDDHYESFSVIREGG